MKRLLFIALAIIPAFSFSQTFTRADKEELVYQTLKQINLSRRWKEIHLIVDTADAALEQFVRQKFPDRKWHLYSSYQLPESLLEMDKKSMLFMLDMWGRNNYWRAGLQIVWVSRSSDSPYNLQASGMCGNDLIGYMIYDECSGKWKFCATPELDVIRGKPSTTSL